MNHPYPGTYIVFEGIVGTGKTTQSKKLFEYLKKQHPNREIIWTREPGGTEVADAIRTVVQGTQFEEEMEPICEAYLYAASRAQSLRSVVMPVLEKNGIVIADRSFITSLVNQGFGRGLDVETILEINKIAVGDLWPDIIIDLDFKIERALQQTFDFKGDKFEAMPHEFYENIRNGYDEIADMEAFRDKWIKIQKYGSIEEVFQKIVSALDKTNL